MSERKHNEPFRAFWGMPEPEAHEPPLVPPKLKTPLDLIKSRSPVVHQYLALWKHGHLYWEQMLLELACYLEEDNALVRERLNEFYAAKLTITKGTP